MSKLLIIPEPIIKALLKEFGNPDGNDWFIILGQSIDEYYYTHKTVTFSQLPKPDNPGTSLDNLKKCLGYSSKTGELTIEKATGANRYIREVLSKKYGKDLSWNYLTTIGLSEKDLLPVASNISKKEKQVDEITTQNQEKLHEHFFTTRINLAGYWLSRFEYISKSRNQSTSGYQIDIERLNVMGSKSLFGNNLAIVSPSGKKYEHELNAQLFGDFLVGYWKNTNTKNIGAFQLFINTNMCVMTGLHLGNANDNTIQSGIWTWIKILDEASEENDQRILNSSLKYSHELSGLMVEWQALGVGIILTDVLNL
jgi:hypothetical protein